MTEAHKRKVTYVLPVYTTLGGLVASVILVWLFAPALMTILFAGNLEKMGQAGDLFGSVNALFSGLAFAGLFWTVFLQRQQLAMQREELELQRKELLLQREEMVASRGELANQVQAQLTLAKVSAAQISAVSHTAHIEALKLQFQMAAEARERTKIVQQIMERGNAVQRVATHLQLIIAPDDDATKFEGVRSGLAHAVVGERPADPN